MVLFDRLIHQIKDILPPDRKIFSYEKSAIGQADRNSILLLKDTAFELGGSQKQCVSTMAVTSSLRFHNSIYLYGQDLFEIKGDNDFGKIVLLEIDDLDEDTAFEKIKELELVRYKFCPEGFMTRASALSMREQIRVSKRAVTQKISFADYGSALIEEYLNHPIVKSVEIIFLTEFDRFDELIMVADKIKNTTSALNHILDNAVFDCPACNLREICDEIDGMKELHKKSIINKK